MFLKVVVGYYKTNEGLFCFGFAGDSVIIPNGRYVKTPTKVTYKFENLKGVYTDGTRQTVFYDNGKLIAFSSNGYYGIIGCPGSGFRNFDFDFGSEVIKIDGFGNKNCFYLTKAGKVFGTGIYSYLGTGSRDSVGYSLTLADLNLEKIVDIEAGNQFIIAVTEDGRVLGTGNNSYGILGRWAGTNRNKPNSRYQTAFEWVECPELEL